MGQADPFASRCSVKGSREQKIFIWLAHCGNSIGFTNRAWGKNREERKEWIKEGTRLSFPPYSSLGLDLPVKPMRLPQWASQIKIFCSRNPFTLQRDAKGSAWPIPLDSNKVYTGISQHDFCMRTVTDVNRFPLNMRNFTPKFRTRKTEGNNPANYL